MYRPWRRQLRPPTPPVPPPDGGTLPFGNELPGQKTIPYRVIFTDLSGNHSGYEGILLNDLSTILTSAQAASDIGGSLSKFRALMGVNDLSDLSNSQTNICKAAAFHPSWLGGYSNNVGYVTVFGGFSVNSYVASIDYTAAFDTTPYSGEYFYPVSTLIAWASNIDWSGGISVVTLAEGTEGAVLSDSYLQSNVPGTNNTNIGCDLLGGYEQGSYGTGLIVGGYGSYFCAGMFISLELGNSISVFSRISHLTAWIEGDTGVSPIIYP